VGSKQLKVNMQKAGMADMDREKTGSYAIEPHVGLETCGTAHGSHRVPDTGLSGPCPLADLIAVERKAHGPWFTVGHRPYLGTSKQTRLDSLLQFPSHASAHASPLSYFLMPLELKRSSLLLSSGPFLADSHAQTPL
jgi:hypothetical protein